MIWESTAPKEYIIINAMAVKPMKKSIRMENIDGSALDKWMLNMNCLYLTIYMTKNAGNVRGCSESKENDMGVNRIKCPTYCVRVSDKRFGVNSKASSVKSFTSLEEMAKWVKKNRERVLRVYYPSKDDFTSALGTSLDIFEEDISKGE